MFKLSKLRNAALAILAIGTFQLSAPRANAATTWTDQCDDEAIAVLIFACDWLTGGDWWYGEMTYWCDEDGHLAYGEGFCLSNS